MHPLQAFQAALSGLEAWWKIVVPALLPFFILSQLLMGLGIVHFLGVFLEPFMRPLFNVPGSAAFVVLMGYTSGAPLSAHLTAQLRSQGLLTAAEGERLICFTNNASPLFMLGAVAVGMLHDPSLGPVIATAHYASNLILGFLFRFYRRGEASAPVADTPLPHLPRRAWQALLEAQRRDGRPLGQLLNDAVTRSFQVLLAVGGFIVLFAVVIRLAHLTGVARWLEKGLLPFLRLLDLDTQSTSAVAAGVLEMTLGTKAAGELPLALSARLAVISFILGWAGLSVHAQVAAMISGTDLRLGPFIGARLLHGIFASKLVLFFYGPAQPVVRLLQGPFPAAATGHALWVYYAGFPLFTLLFFTSLTALGLLFYTLLRRSKNYWS
ncbi:MAG TPA: sporulation integral membrane protein YlbJ [Peptococcaceae bacterium]|nr:MAG: Nucleoside recognition [Moorella sp. 60_41]HBT46344.1 sporulation integral membrane protein YlbJ [Peptococcaceae bacterium]